MAQIFSASAQMFPTGWQTRAQSGVGVAWAA